MKKINKGVFLFFLSVLLTSCSYVGIKAPLTSNRFDDIMLSGKKQFQKHSYQRARQYFDRVLKKSPDSYEAKEARFYINMMNFLDDFPESSKKISFLDGGYPDFMEFVLSLSEEVHRGRRASYVINNRLKAAKKNQKKQNLVIENMKKRLSKLVASEESKQTLIAALSEEISLSKTRHKKKLAELLEEKNKSEKKLKDLQESYQVLREIEMRKERREKELRELGP